MSRQDEERLGLSQVMEWCRCRSPQGRRKKMARRYYTPAERGLLERELVAVGNLAEVLGDDDAEARKAAMLLSHFRDIQGTVKGLRDRRLLDTAELFEIKQALRLFRELSSLRGFLDAADIDIKTFPSLEALLDPDGLGTTGFYIYDSYSEKLAEMRKKRSLFERDLMAASGKERALLFDKRRAMIAREEEEEIRVTERLCGELTLWAEALDENLDNIGTLDFRLARAELAASWGVGKPILTDGCHAATLNAFWNPVIDAHLRARGSSYERQSAVIAPGTTVLSGPNMGGKSVALKAMALALILTQLGYFPPAAYLETPLFDFISYSSDHLDTTRKGLSSFGAEVIRIRDDAVRSKKARGLVVLDEPCRGTNPEEATLLIGALCRYYAALPGAFIVATHYAAPVSDHIAHIRIRGIRAGALAEKKRTMPDGSPLPDDEAIRAVESMMDFRLEPVDGASPVPTGAIRVASWLGMDEDVMRIVKEMQEQIWQN